MGTMAEWLARAPVVLVRVLHTRGSVPREQGAMMAVSATAIAGTVGGGQMEWQAIAHARAALQAGTMLAEVRRHALGPQHGQCCGGVVQLVYETVPQGTPWPAQAAAALRAGREADLPSTVYAQRVRPATLHVSLFGGGHVGRALVDLLGRLPCRVSWVDSRDEIFPDVLPPQVHAEHSAPVQAAVHDLQCVPPGSHVLVMSFSHAEDLDIIAACLARQRARGDLPFVGLIGSRSKWATFRRRLMQRGTTAAELAHVTCPIGAPGIAGKEPEVIALAVCAQLFALRSADEALSAT